MTETSVILESYREVRGLCGLLKGIPGRWAWRPVMPLGILTLRPACPQHAHPHCSRGEGGTTKLLGPKRCCGTKGSLTQQTLLHLIGQVLSYFCSWLLSHV